MHTVEPITVIGGMYYNITDNKLSNIEDNRILKVNMRLKYKHLEYVILIYYLNKAVILLEIRALSENGVYIQYFLILFLMLLFVMR